MQRVAFHNSRVFTTDRFLASFVGHLPVLGVPSIVVGLTSLSQGSGVVGVTRDVVVHVRYQARVRFVAQQCSWHKFLG